LVYDFKVKESVNDLVFELLRVGDSGVDTVMSAVAVADTSAVAVGCVSVGVKDTLRVCRLKRVAVADAVLSDVSESDSVELQLMVADREGDVVVAASSSTRSAVFSTTSSDLLVSCTRSFTL
jgi:hypothetical protein